MWFATKLLAWDSCNLNSDKGSRDNGAYHKQNPKSSAGPNPKTICSITRNARDCFTMCVCILEIKDLESMLLEFDRLSNV
jgi:hypothetical protein